MPHRKRPAGRAAHPEVSVSEKVAFLRSPAAYPEPTATVEVRETHMSWVFLTDSHAYKLKKPVRYPFLDYGMLDKRQAMCSREVHLNRRLAAGVYIGTVPLLVRAEGGLALGEVEADGGGTAATDIVEWLVKMVRLPAGLMLDQAIRDGKVDAAAVRRTAAHLAAFYRAAPRVDFSSEAYVARFATELANNMGQLNAWGIPERRTAPVTNRLRAFLEEGRPPLAARTEGRRIVEGHGDLRPEHVYLGEPPAIIDCLEFSRDLRLIDPLEELAFLAMECALLKAEEWGALFLEVYTNATGDMAPSALIRFYMATRACLRARLALAHLQDGEPHEEPKWRARTDRYLDLAARYAELLAA